MSDPTLDILDTIAAIQEGDVETIQTILSNRILSANAKDENGCSLLHWAAINNRISVAKLLIEYGANSCAGGVLNESPLQWSMRKRYYAMAELLVEKLHVDLRHKSAQGLDALHLCCRLNDLSGMFLLLYWGANPDSTDNDGNTPVLWLIKSGASPTKSEMIRLLVKFGANVLAQDPVSKDGIFHICAKHPSYDYSLLFFLYQAGKNSFPFMLNSSSLTPYAQSIHAENRQIAGFLFDVLFFNYFPYWLPAVIVCSHVVVSFVLLQIYGYVFMSVYFPLISVALFFLALQPRVVDHFGRIYIGIYFGCLISFCGHFLLFIAPLLSILTAGSGFTLFIGTIYLGFSFASCIPATVGSESENEIVKRIIESSPSDGTDEENSLLYEKVQETKAKGIKIIKDSFTGKVQIVRHGNGRSDKSGAVRIRATGPMLCCTCVCDKRLVRTIGATEKADSRTFSDIEDQGKQIVERSSELIISFASHCYFCGNCVIDVGCHCYFLGNCAGIGNRRLYIFYLVTAVFTLLFYFLCSKWVQHNIYCISSASFFDRLYQAEICGFSHCVMLLLQIMAILITASFFIILYLEFTFIGRQTDFSQDSAKISQPFLKEIGNFMRFLRTGNYIVIRKPADESPESDRIGRVFNHCENINFPVNALKRCREENRKVLSKPPPTGQVITRMMENVHNSSEDEEFVDGFSSDCEHLLRERR